MQPLRRHAVQPKPDRKRQPEPQPPDVWRDALPAPRPSELETFLQCVRNVYACELG